MRLCVATSASKHSSAHVTVNKAIADDAGDDGVITNISILRASTSGDAKESDGLQIHGAATRLSGVNLRDRLCE